MPPKNKKPKKQQPRNAYAIFVDDFWKESRDNGERMTRQQAFTAASSQWNKLDKAMRQHYEVLASEEKAQVRQYVGRMDSTGQLLSAIANEEEDLVKELNDKADTVESYVKQGSVKDTAERKFYVISFNIFCQTDSKDYVPAEVGLVEFSISQGITRQYHAFIAPGQIPLGYTFKCMEHSEKTHTIPLHDFTNANSDYGEIYNNIWQMIRVSNSSEDDCNLLFCLPEEIPATEYLLDLLHKKSNDGYQRPEVYDLAVLFYNLVTHTDETQEFSTGIAREWLGKPTYSYSPNISCQWHAQQDTQPYCSLGVVKRSCYLMTSVLCTMYNTVLIPGRHAPDDRDSTVLYVSEPRPASASSRSSSRLNQRERNDSYVSGSSCSVSARSSFLPPNDSVYVPSVAGSISGASSSSRYASAVSKPSQSYSQATWGPVSSQSFTIDSGDFPSISGSRSGRDSVLSNVSMSTQGTMDHQPVYSSEIASVNGSVSGISDASRSHIRVPNTSPIVMGLKGIGRGKPAQK